MKLGHIIGAGMVLMAGGMLLAWSLDDNKAQASIESSEQNVASFSEGDSKMSKSQSAARTSFDQFWQRVSTDATGLDAISIKVAVPHQNGPEHLWMTGCKSADAQAFNCFVSNKPVRVSLELGKQYSFERGAISDWMYRQDGKIYGGYSIRALLPTLPADQAEAMTAMLAPLPQ